MELKLHVERNSEQQQKLIAVVKLCTCIPNKNFVLKKRKFYHIIKFHKVLELFPNRQVRIVHMEQL